MVFPQLYKNFKTHSTHTKIGGFFPPVKAVCALKHLRVGVANLGLFGIRTVAVNGEVELQRDRLTVGGWGDLCSGLDQRRRAAWHLPSDR